MAKYEEEPPELMKKWHLAIILEGQWKIMLYFTWIWGDKLYRIKLTEKGAQNVHICVHFTVNLLLRHFGGNLGLKWGFGEFYKLGFAERKFRLVPPP